MKRKVWNSLCDQLAAGWNGRETLFVLGTSCLDGSWTRQLGDTRKIGMEVLV